MLSHSAYAMGLIQEKIRLITAVQQLSVQFAVYKTCFG